MIRLFVGLALPDDLRERLAGLCGGLPTARWTDPADFHLTLRFVGEIDEGQADDLAVALARVHAPAFDLVLDGAGLFGNARKARAVWIGVAPNPALADLNQRIESACVQAGLPPETRRFHPHVTLASLQGGTPDRLRDYLGGIGLFRSRPIAVESFGLFSSWFGRRPSYDREMSFDLTPRLRVPDAE